MTSRTNTTISNEFTAINRTTHSQRSHRVPMGGGRQRLAASRFGNFQVGEVVKWTLVIVCLPCSGCLPWVSLIYAQFRAMNQLALGAGGDAELGIQAWSACINATPIRPTNSCPCHAQMPSFALRASSWSVRRRRRTQPPPMLQGQTVKADTMQGVPLFGALPGPITAIQVVGDILWVPAHRAARPVTPRPRVESQVDHDGACSCECSAN